jgi:hypothetical protein
MGAPPIDEDSEDGPVAGDVPGTPQAEVISLSASVFGTQLRVLREMLGDEGFERGLGRLPAELASRVRTTPALGWVPFEVVEPVVVAMAEEAGEPIERFQALLAQQTTQEQINGVWWVLMRLTTRSALLRRMSTLWRKTWSHGHVRWVSERRGTMQLQLRGMPGASEYVLRGVGHAVSALLRHAGSRDVRVRRRRARDGADYDIDWTPG